MSTEIVALLKLVTGEELIAKITEAPTEDNPYYTIKDPRMIGLQPTDNGVSFGLAPWVPWALNEYATKIEIHQDKLLVEPIEGLAKEIKDGYAQQVSGIQLQ